MSIISEYVFNNPKLDEISNITNNTHNGHDKKNGSDFKDKVEIICEVEFIDKLRNKIKFVKINRYQIRYQIRKREIASKNRFAFNKVIKLTIIIEKEINKFGKNTLLKMHIPMGMRRFFFNIANNEEFIINNCVYSNRKFHRFYRDWYLYNLLRNTIRL